MQNSLFIRSELLTQHQKWNLQKLDCYDGVKMEFKLVLAVFRANLSFTALRMLPSGLNYLKSYDMFAVDYGSFVWDIKFCVVSRMIFEGPLKYNVL